MAKIKICGLRSPEDISIVNQARPDLAGFIVEYEKSFRSISAGTLRSLTAGLHPDIVPVGVFVNAGRDLPEQLLRDQVIRMVQLHGQESEEDIRYLKEKTGCPVIKAFSVRTREDIEMALSSPADYILLDQGSGGTGVPFDWSLVPDIGRPWFLAGGLCAGNLEKAVKGLKPWAVDLSSSLETEKRKDREKVEEAVRIVRCCGEG